MAITNLTWSQMQDLLELHKGDAEVLENRIQTDGIEKYAIEIFYSLLDAENLLGILRAKVKEEHEKLMQKTGTDTAFDQCARFKQVGEEDGT